MGRGAHSVTKPDGTVIHLGMAKNRRIVADAIGPVGKCGDICETVRLVFVQSSAHSPQNGHDGASGAGASIHPHIRGTGN